VKSSKTHGFTLVELMVTIVIITVLASIIILFSKRGLESAKSSKCIANMRQIHSGVQEIVYNGVKSTNYPAQTFPPQAGEMILSDGIVTPFVWIDLVAESMGMAALKGTSYIWNSHPKDTVFQNPFSSFSVGGKESKWQELANNPSASGGSFVLNGNISGISNTTDNPPHLTRVSQIPYPASTILLAESDDKLAESQSITWGYIKPSDAPQGSYKASAHCLFTDGHVELILNKHLKDKAWLDHYSLIKPPDKVLAKP